MALLVYTCAFYTFVSMNSRLCKLLKIKSVILKDKALFQANPVSIDAGTAELPAGQYWRQTDKLTDRQLYVVDQQEYLSYGVGALCQFRLLYMSPQFFQLYVYLVYYNYIIYYATSSFTYSYTVLCVPRSYLHKCLIYL